MNRLPRRRPLALAPLALAMAAGLGAHLPLPARADDPTYRATVDRVAGMVSDPEARALAGRHGLQLLDLTWEDTGRFEGSSVGPNISDVTIEVESGRGRRLMPVLRFPNFSDRTADVALDRIFLPVGNHLADGPQRAISLRDFLAEPGRYLSRPAAGRIRQGSLLAPRDSHALISAQAAFLPVPRGARATFHPVIFNYQSTARNPAVLTLLVTRQGTSLTVIDNARDSLGGSWGQRLFFNAGGQRAPLTAERLSDVEDRGTTSNGEAAADLGEDANLLMLVQVPLRHRPPERRKLENMGALAAPPAPAAKAMARADDLESAVLGHGDLEGPYAELDGLEVERDPRFPVRVTVQFYQATSSARVTPAQMAGLAGLIGKVYQRGDWVGSLVCPGPGDAGRPTRWSGAGPAPDHLSWTDFPGLVERWWKGRGPRQPAGIR